MLLYKYHGAGNDFLLADGRSAALSVSAGDVRRLCDRHTGFGSDGFMLLEDDGAYDFRMSFWNPDGSSGMMCGNGGRCIAAFADRLGIVPKSASAGLKCYHFMAPDGPHTAYVLSRDGNSCTVRLGMKDITDIRSYGDGAWFLDTGTRHCVVFRDDVEGLDIAAEGPRYRHDPRFAPQGANADFVTVLPGGGIRVRTFEKGVEGETLACGTGIVASAAAAYIRHGAGTTAADGSVSVKVQARIAGLEVSFRPGASGSAEGDGRAFSDVWLTGPAEFVGTVSPAE